MNSHVLNENFESIGIHGTKEHVIFGPNYKRIVKVRVDVLEKVQTKIAAGYFTLLQILRGLIYVTI